MSEAEVRAVEARLDIPRLVAQGTAGAVTETFWFPARARGAVAEGGEPPRGGRRPRSGLSPAHPCGSRARAFRYAQCTTDKPGGAAVTTKALRLFTVMTAAVMLAAGANAQGAKPAAKDEIAGMSRERRSEEHTSELQSQSN